MSEPTSDLVKIVGLATTTADELRAIGWRYQHLTEKLMYDEHGIHTFHDADDYYDGGDDRAADYQHGQIKALENFDALDATSIVSQLREQEFDAAANALHQLREAVYGIIQSTALRADGRADARGVAAIFGTAVSQIHRSVLRELNRVDGRQFRPLSDGAWSLARPIARTDDGDLAVGPGCFSEEESEDFIETVANEIRRGRWGLSEVAPRTFLPNATIGQDEHYSITGVQLMQLYVKPVTLFVGCMSEVAVARLENQLLYNTTANDEHAVAEMVTAVCWLGGERLGVF
jgi:hypothetical protein